MLAQKCTSWLSFTGPDSGESYGRAVTADSKGNAYYAGDFTGNATFGNVTLFSSNVDVFFTKHDSIGNGIWAKKPFIGYAVIVNLAVDSSDNIYMLCNYQDSIKVDTINGYLYADLPIVVPGIYSTFIAKFNKDGHALWAKKVSTLPPVSSGTVSGCSFSISVSGNIYVSLTNEIKKLDSNGNLIWAIPINTMSFLSVDLNDNVFITGNQEGYLIIGDSTFLATNSGYEELFITKLNAQGIMQWFKRPPSVYDSYGTGVVTDSSGNVYCTGGFGDSITFGNTTLNTWYLNAFMVKYDPLGNVLWAKKLGSISMDMPQSIVGNEKGNIYIAGPISQSNFTIDTVALYDGNEFVGKFDFEGNFVWGKGLGGGYSFSGHRKLIYTDNKDNCFFTGTFDGGGFFEATTITGNGTFENELYFGKIDSTGILFDKKYLDHHRVLDLYCGETAYLNACGVDVPYSLQTSNALSCIWTPNLFIDNDSSALTYASPPYTTEYVVEITVSGCNYYDTVIVNVDTSNIFIDFNYYDTDLYTVFHNLSYGAQNYFWDFGNGESSTNYDATHFFENGIHTVCLTGSNPCVTKTYCDSAVYVNVGVSENEIKSDLTIISNQHTNQTILNFNKEMVNCQIKILDLLGRQINDINFNGNQLIIDGNEFSKGVYLVQIIENEQIKYSAKIVNY